MNSIYKSTKAQATVQLAYDQLLNQLPADIEKHCVTTSQGQPLCSLPANLMHRPLFFSRVAL